MKKGNSILVMFFVICMGLFLSCFGGDESDSIPMGGAEDQLVGDWWSDDVFGLGYSDGSRFDGKGGGYDLSDDGSGGYCVDTDDPIIYRYDGTTLTVYEDNHETTGTVIVNGDGTVTYKTDLGDIVLSEVTASGNCNSASSSIP